MHFVIQENIDNESAFVNLIAAIDKLGLPYTLVKVIPFVGEITPNINFDSDERVICFGSYSMRFHALRRGWLPGVYDIEWFPYQKLIDALGDDVLNHDAVICKFKDAKPATDEFFIRPTHDGKEFAGVVKSVGQLQEWQNRVIALGLKDNGATLTGETEVMYASLKKIYNEHRYFVVGGRVVTGSQYKLGNRVVYQESNDGIDIAQGFVDRLKPFIDQPYVIDVALTDDGHKVIELNTMNCAGFYACDMQKLVEALVNYNDR